MSIVDPEAKLVQRRFRCSCPDGETRFAPANVRLREELLEVADDEQRECPKSPNDRALSAAVHPDQDRELAAQAQAELAKPAEVAEAQAVDPHGLISIVAQHA